MKQSPLDFVRYCPGDACGSPGSMSRVAAERYQAQDMEYLREMEKVGQRFSNFPHIGGECAKCRNPNPPMPEPARRGARHVR